MEGNMTMYIITPIKAQVVFLIDTIDSITHASKQYTIQSRSIVTTSHIFDHTQRLALFVYSNVFVSKY